VSVKILCAEDNASFRGMINAMLADKGVSIDFAVNGHEAVSACVANEYDAILMDIDMPVLSGLKAAKQIRAIEHDRHQKHTPVLFLTGAQTEPEVDSDLEPGDGRIAKPFTSHALIDALGFALANNPPRAAE
jgi:CheY-like chemotaxis protein